MLTKALCRQIAMLARTLSEVCDAHAEGFDEMTADQREDSVAVIRRQFLSLRSSCKNLVKKRKS